MAHYPGHPAKKKVLSTTTAASSATTSSSGNRLRTSEEATAQIERARAQARDLGMDPFSAPDAVADIVQPGVGPTGPLGPSGTPPSTSPNLLDILAAGGRTGDWRVPAGILAWIKDADIAESGRKILGQVRNIFQGGDKIVDVGQVARRAADSLRPHLLSTGLAFGGAAAGGAELPGDAAGRAAPAVATAAQAAPAAAGMTDGGLTSGLEKVNEAIKAARGMLSPEAMGDPQFMGDFREVLARRRAIVSEQARRHDVAFQAGMENEWRQFLEKEEAAKAQFARELGAIDEPELGQLMTPEQERFQRDKYRRQLAMAPPNPATDFDWAMVEDAARTRRLLEANTALKQGKADAVSEAERAEREKAAEVGIAGDRLKAAGRTQAEIDEQDATRAAQTATRIQTQKAKRDAARVANKARIAATAAKKKADRMEARLLNTKGGPALIAKARADAKAAKDEADRTVAVAKVTRKINTLTTQNEGYDDKIKLLRGRQKTVDDRLEGVKADIAKTIGVFKEGDKTITVTEGQSRKENSKLYDKKQELEDAWNEIEKTKVPELEAKIATNNKKLGDLGVDVAAAGAGVEVPAEQGAVPAGGEAAPGLPKPTKVATPVPAGRSVDPVEDIMNRIIAGESPVSAIQAHAGKLTTADKEKIATFLKRRGIRI